MAPGRIENRSIAPAGVNLLGEPLKGLGVPDGHSLLLLGGDIAINGGGLNALGGRVELAGLAAPGEVALNVDDNHLSLNIPNDLTRADISLTNEAVVNTSGEGGGEIQVFGRRVMLKEGSQILATTLGSEAGEGITVDASELVELIGTGFENFEQIYVVGSLSGQLRPSNPGTGLFTGAVGAGSGGAIEINTKQLKLRDGAIVFSPTFSQGIGGNLSVRVLQSVELIGSGLVSSTLQSATGAAGDIIIDTRRLIVRDGAVVVAATISEGNGGDIMVKASESVEILRTPPEALVVTGFFTTAIVDTRSTRLKGNAGDIKIDTSLFLVQDIARLSAESFIGAGGNITITADNVKLINNGQIATTAFGSDNAGDIIVKVQEKLLLSGTNSGLFANTELNSSGNGGSIFINNPKTIQILDNANIAVDSQGIGVGGNIEIRGDSLTLDNQANLLAETASNTGGNITLLLDDLLLMRRDSRISTTAGTTGVDGNGGNISIDADLITSIPNENSDITANAFSGQGGRITITGEGIFGIEERPAIEGNRTNDIDASSQFGNSGEITLDVSLDPSRGLTQLPSTLVDPSGQINRTCAASNRQSQFTVTGRGGLPENPTDLFSPDLVQDDFGTVIAREEDEEIEGQAEGKNDLINHPPKQIIEAQGWIIDEEGNVVLTAYVPNGTPHGGWQNSVNCQVSETASP
jgi:large exoprotein involved in heme utilization and adhesion